MADAWAIYKSIIESVAPYQFWIGVAAAVFFLISAVFWIIASRAVTPDQLNGAFYIRDGRIEGDLSELVRGVYRQTERNALAAGFTAIAAILTGIDVLIGVRLGP